MQCVKILKVNFYIYFIMHECKRCYYRTIRLSNYKDHINRSPLCQPAEYDTLAQKLCCPVCHTAFNTRQGKHQHMKNVRCEAPGQASGGITTQETTAGDAYMCSYCHKKLSRSDNLKRHLIGCGFKHLSEARTVHDAHNNTHTHTSNRDSNNNTHTHNRNIDSNSDATNNDNSTNNNVTIVYNSYDKPFIDHIDSETVKELYLGNGRNIRKMMKEGVKRIWKDIPENNSFKLPFHGKRKDPLQPCDIIRVYCDGEVQLFPVHHVINVILQKCAHVCERYLRQHYYEETIPGRACLMHANVLEELALEPQEVWENDHKNRSAYHPFVKSALLECILIDIH